MTNVKKGGLQRVRLFIAIFIVLLIVVDAFLLLLRSRGMYVGLLEPDGYFYLVGVHLVAFVLTPFLFKLPLPLIMMGATITMSFSICFLWLAYSFFGIMASDVRHYSSPSGTTALVAKCRVATLGESQHMYRFYQPLGRGGWVWQYLDHQDLTVITKSNEDMREGEIGEPEWRDAFTAVFATKDGRKIVVLER